MVRADMDTPQDYESLRARLSEERPSVPAPLS